MYTLTLSEIQEIVEAKLGQRVKTWTVNFLLRGFTKPTLVVPGRRLYDRSAADAVVAIMLERERRRDLGKRATNEQLAEVATAAMEAAV